MKKPTIILAILAAVLPLAGWSATDDTSNLAPAVPPLAAAPPAAPAFSVPPGAMLSRPARDVVKMTSSGVSDDVIKAYVDNSPTTFNLSADNIIHMQGAGVSSGVASAMLNHDKKLSDQAAMNPPPMPPAQPGQAPYPGQAAETPPAQYQNPVSTYDMPTDTSYYSDLAPYGNWNYLPDYGWCWAPGFGLNYAYYPWGTLRYGRWWNFPGRGWCWLPGRGFNNFGGRGFVGGRVGFGGTRFASGARFSSGRFGGFGGGVSVSHIGGGFHSGGFSHSGGSSGHFSGGTHFSGGSHFSGGGRGAGGGHR